MVRSCRTTAHFPVAVSYEGCIIRWAIRFRENWQPPYTVESWVAANGCRRTPVTKVWPQKVNDGTRVTEERYQGGREGVEVVLYTIHGAGHVWPGRDSGMTILGKTTENIDANETMWSFFQRYRR